jgi:phosphonate degradation associated HDIG domain protein
MTSLVDLTDRILDLYRTRGDMEYEGEGVSQIEHAAQCGALACAAGATRELQLAAWLHDIGHLLAGLPGTPTLEGVDDHHERRGAAFLCGIFGPEVVGPVALHVSAKRYLVAVNPDYYERLSLDSRRSLGLQGGPMSLDEQREFMAQPFSGDALRVRAWDETAKRPHFAVPRLAQLEELLRAVHAR